MSLKLYDLAAADETIRFSPHCWKVRMALAHKGLEVETIAWHLTDKDRLPPGCRGLVPVLVDGRVTIENSWNIALYLESAFPERPALFSGDLGPVAFVNAWVDRELMPSLLPLLVMNIHDAIAEKDRDYFRQSREQRLGKRLEVVADEYEIAEAQIKRLLETLRLCLKQRPFLGGDEPLYVDYCVFGAFMWARCLGRGDFLNRTDEIFAWNEALLDRFGGLGRHAPIYQEK